MLSSNGTQVTIEFFLNQIKARSPKISPLIFMTDHDHAQVNAIRSAFPNCPRIFYCWWHMLRAIRTHFNTKEFPDLWSLIQDWVRTTDEKEFNVWWARSRAILMSLPALPSILAGNGFPIRRCGPQCHIKIGLFLRRVIQICC